VHGYRRPRSSVDELMYVINNNELISAPQDHQKRSELNIPNTGINHHQYQHQIHQIHHSS